MRCFTFLETEGDGKCGHAVSRLTSYSLFGYMFGYLQLDEVCYNGIFQ
jgi:hypothetical protein